MQLELSDLDSKGMNCKNISGLEDWTHRYLNRVETLAHLIMSEKIPKSIAEFFKALHDAYTSKIHTKNKSRFTTSES